MDQLRLLKVQSQNTIFWGRAEAQSRSWQYICQENHGKVSSGVLLLWTYQAKEQECLSAAPPGYWGRRGLCTIRARLAWDSGLTEDLFYFVLLALAVQGTGYKRELWGCSTSTLIETDLVDKPTGQMSISQKKIFFLIWFLRYLTLRKFLGASSKIFMFFRTSKMPYPKPSQNNILVILQWAFPKLLSFFCRMNDSLTKKWLYEKESELANWISANIYLIWFQSPCIWELYIWQS